jgi:hypothetical protein
MNEQRGIVDFELLEQRPDPLERIRAREGDRRQGDTDAAPRDRSVHFVRIRCLELYRAPPSKGVRQLLETILIGVE